MDARPAAHASSILYAGIDEAGYGPRIGPLAVGLAAFRVQRSDTAVRSEVDVTAAPDLWRTLRGAVRRAGGVSVKPGGAIFVDDSKRLKGSNSLKHRSPLDRLEQGVFSFLRLLGRAPTTDLELFSALGASVELAPWYLGEPIGAPVSTTSQHVGALANALGACMSRRGVETVAMRCELVGASAFNEIVAEHGSKAAVNFSAAVVHLRTLWRKFGCESPIVAIDRHGGRIRYGRLLAQATPDADVRVIDETPECSAYELVEKRSSAGGCDRRRMFVRFDVHGDSKHFPTALASMTAKLVRELAMARFNRHWSRRLPGLKPTAGYGADARRWLHLVEPHLVAGDRERLVRRA